MFSCQTYVRRRESLAQEVGSGVIFFPGNSQSPRNFRDNTYPFRQDSTFLYYTGLSHPSLALVIDAESGEEILFGDDVLIDHIVWTGPQETMAEKARLSGITKYLPYEKLPSFLETALKTKREIHYLPPYRAETVHCLDSLLGSTQKDITKKSSEHLIKAVSKQRIYKSDEEVEQISQAVNVSVDMHLAGIRAAQPGRRETDVVAEVTRVAIENGCDLAFPVIATVNGQILHNHCHTNLLREEDLFLLDAGAENGFGYCGDLSSTFPVSREFTAQQKEVYNVCLASHEAAISMLRPGISFQEIYYNCSTIIFDGMKELGLAQGNTEDAVLQGAHAMFFPCGLGHLMGLDVHDMENFGEQLVGWSGEKRPGQFGIKSLRLGRSLEPGFVLTIEPGIYFIPELMELWKQKGLHTEFLNFNELEKFKNFGGIRNEENYLITSNGCRRLGKRKPKTVDDIERLSASR